MSELAKILSEKQKNHDKPTMESRLASLSLNFERAIYRIADIPIKINRSMLTFKKKLSIIESQLIEIKESINSLRESVSETDNSESQQKYLKDIDLSQFQGLHINKPLLEQDLKIIQRICWNCKRILTFEEFCESNPHTDPKFLHQLWKHPCIELYCCYCYSFMEKQLELQKLKDQSKAAKQTLNKREYEALSFLENHIQKQILLQDNLSTICAFNNLEGHYDCEFSLESQTITSLKLSNCNLKSIPPEIKLFSNLKVLVLNDNQIFKIPEWINSLPNLKFLDLSGNPFQTIPRCMLENRTLTIIPRKIRTKHYLRAILEDIKEKFGRA